MAGPGFVASCSRRPIASLSLLLGTLFALLSINGCRGLRPKPTAVQAPSPPVPPVSIGFTDVSELLGVRFRHTNGASGHRYLAETMGSGGAFLDTDGDGRLDLFLVNSAALPGFKGDGPFYPALFHQRADGRFEDVTRRAGMAIEGYGMGCAVGDYDNDGHPDLYLTAYGHCRLFHNRGNGTFVEVTRSARVPGPAWGTSAAWLDVDRDGFLDLFVCGYCRWSPALNQSCGDICGPAYYGGTTSVLYHNNRDGTFTDVSRRAHIAAAAGKALGVAVLDADGDGWPDLAVANDTVPNWLFRNRGDGTFTEVGVESGMAYGANGQARAGMGVDTADFDHSGHEALLIGNNASEGLALFRLEAASGAASGTHFTDGAEEDGLFQPSVPFSAFGALFVDVDRDGFPDVVTTNGHINQHQAQLGGGKGFAQRMQLYHNEPDEDPGGRRFREVGAQAGAALSRPRVGRGLAGGDFDGDGAPDLLVCSNNGPASLLRNEGKDQNHWLVVRPRGTKSNRDGLGTRVVLHAAGQSQTAWVRGGSSYASDSEHVARFGLGRETRIDRIELHWPSGAVQTVRSVKADQLLRITEAAAQ